MKLGQISVIHFLSNISASILGFISTIYIARVLGSGVLGTYSVALAVVSWLGLLGTMGITSAITKRVSEQEDSEAYALAGLIIITTLFVFISILVTLFQHNINRYVGFPAAPFIVGMLGVLLGYNLITSLLSGKHLVHITGIFSPIKTGSRAGIQIGAVISGIGVAGLFGGYILGYLIVILLGSYIVVKKFERVVIPERKHFNRIIDYAKFSWLGSLRSNAFNWVDIALLGFFVSNSFIGYYTAAWNISQFLIIFGASLSQTLFPEISKISSEQSPRRVSSLLNTGLSYAGLFLIPGLVGGGILGEQLLRIYGPNFAQARVVLVILIVATLVQSYQRQITTTLNAIDRPDLAFRVNTVFICTNIALNALLIYLFGWVGAAVATATSVGISLCTGYLYLNSIIKFQVPVKEILKQVLASAIMGVFVWGALVAEQQYIHINHNLLLVFSLVTLGASIYFVSLLILSVTFRNTVRNNLPYI
ncbi:polysaccharide biosynthesis protein [Halorubrum sp. DM2]|uniref:flippase n=1 Tax=Halorubrum sp. DM2 TaxID=2527867 RepID=UPI0024B83FEC|nr:flippase [Halorubrum sp. DM2]VTT88166.1 polysaccharide biosynthesis protein [Halorubrum sp. DM2]